MSDESQQPLQFDFAGDTSTPPACATCNRPLDGFYFECNGAHVCEVCKVRAEEDYRKDSGWNRMPSAFAWGLGAAIAGSIVYYLFIKVLNMELGLMAIGVGWLVGKAVMRGSNYRGGRKYQVLALALTYFAITFSYVPLMFQEMAKSQDKKTASVDGKETPAPAAKDEKPVDLNAGTVAIGLGFLVLIILAAPFLAGFGNFMGWIIIAIGLWEAWKFTREVPFAVSGPYDLNTPAES